MSQHPCFQQQYPDLGDIKPKLLMQGRLYINPFRDEPTPTSCLGYPIEQSQDYGYWCYADDLSNINEPLYILKRPMVNRKRNEFATIKANRTRICTLSEPIW